MMTTLGSLLSPFDTTRQAQNLTGQRSGIGNTLAQLLLDPVMLASLGVAGAGGIPAIGRYMANRGLGKIGNPAPARMAGEMIPGFMRAAGGVGENGLPREAGTDLGAMLRFATGKMPTDAPGYSPGMMQDDLSSLTPWLSRQILKSVESGKMQADPSIVGMARLRASGVPLDEIQARMGAAKGRSFNLRTGTQGTFGDAQKAVISEGQGDLNAAMNTGMSEVGAQHPGFLPPEYSAVPPSGPGYGFKESLNIDVNPNEINYGTLKSGGMATSIASSPSRAKSVDEYKKLREVMQALEGDVDMAPSTKGIPQKPAVDQAYQALLRDKQASGDLRSMIPGAKNLSQEQVQDISQSNANPFEIAPATREAAPKPLSVSRVRPKAQGGLQGGMQTAPDADLAQMLEENSLKDARSKASRMFEAQSISEQEAIDQARRHGSAQVGAGGFERRPSKMISQNQRIGEQDAMAVAPENMSPQVEDLWQSQITDQVASGDTPVSGPKMSWVEGLPHGDKLELWRAMRASEIKKGLRPAMSESMEDDLSMGGRKMFLPSDSVKQLIDSEASRNASPIADVPEFRFKSDPTKETMASFLAENKQSAIGSIEQRMSSIQRQMQAKEARVIRQATVEYMNKQKIDSLVDPGHVTDFGSQYTMFPGGDMSRIFSPMTKIRQNNPATIAAMMPAALRGGYDVQGQE